MNKRPSAKQKYVFFDLDRTLLAHDTMLLFCNYIVKQRRIRTFFLFLFLPALLLTFLHILKSLQLKRIFFSFLFYMRTPALDYYAENFVQTVLKPLFFPELLDLIKKHREAGHFIVLNTASIEPYVKYIAKELGFDAYYATKIELQDPMPLAPRIFKNNKGAAKIEAMKELLPSGLASKIGAHYQGKGSYTDSRAPKLNSAYTYTDSLADLPLINLAENVIIVQPSEKKLRAMALQKDWTLIEPQGRITKGSWDDALRRFFIALCQISGLYGAPLSK